MENYWIDVNRMLPGDNEVVLCYYDGEIFEGVIHVRYANGTTFKQVNLPLHYSIHVTHWMPRPENPVVLSHNQTKEDNPLKP